MSTQTLQDRYEAGLKMYEEGSDLEGVLTYFQELYQEAPNDIRLHVSLGWLHLLLGHKEEAIAFSKRAKSAPQARYNLALTLLTFKEKGVRERFDEAVRLGGHEGLHDALDNLEDALKRKGGTYPAAEKMIAWIKDLH